MKRNVMMKNGFMQWVVVGVIALVVVSACWNGGGDAVAGAPTTSTTALATSPVEERLQLKVTGVKVIDGRFVFELTADNQSPDPKELPIVNFLAEDETGTSYQADRMLSAWIGVIPASRMLTGWIALDKPVRISTSKMRVGFTNLKASADIFAEFAQGVEIQATEPVSVTLAAFSHSNGLRLTVTKVENLNNMIFRFYISAKREGDDLPKVIHVTTEPVGIAGSNTTIQMEKSREIDEIATLQLQSAWLKLETREFFVQDEHGRRYHGAPDSDWGEGVGDGIAGSITISEPLRSDVRLMSVGFYDEMNAMDIKVDNIPIPWRGTDGKVTIANTPVPTSTPLPTPTLTTTSIPLLKINKSISVRDGITIAAVSIESSVNPFQGVLYTMVFVLENKTNETFQVDVETLIKDDQNFVLFSKNEGDILGIQGDYGVINVPAQSRLQLIYDLPLTISKDAKTLAVQFAKGVVFNDVPIPSR